MSYDTFLLGGEGSPIAIVSTQNLIETDRSRKLYVFERKTQRIFEPIGLVNDLRIRGVENELGTRHFPLLQKKILVSLIPVLIAPQAGRQSA